MIGSCPKRSDGLRCCTEHPGGWGDGRCCQCGAAVGSDPDPTASTNPAEAAVIEAAVEWVERATGPNASHPNLWADREDFALIAAVRALTGGAS